MIATRDAMEIIYGSENIRLWGDKNNRQRVDEIQASVDYAISAAQSRLDNRLRPGPYQLPFVVNETSSQYDAELIDIYSREAGIILYDNRMVVDRDSTEDEVRAARKTIDTFVNDVMGGRKLLPDQTRKATSFIRALR